MVEWSRPTPISEVPQIAAVRVERAVLAVAKIAGRHDAEGADGGERANLRAAQLHVAVRAQTRSRSGPRGSSRSRVNTSRVSSRSRCGIAEPAAAALA